MTRFGKVLLSTLVLLALGACDFNGERPDAPADDPDTGLTAFEEEHGIGPFTEEVTLDEPVDEELAAIGQDVFETSCEACHMLDESFVGPAVGDVLDRRSPTFVMNMIMNPSEMADRHPVVQEMLRDYPVVMPYQNITEEQARAIVEYLRTVNEHQ